MSDITLCSYDMCYVIQIEIKKVNSGKANEFPSKILKTLKSLTGSDDNHFYLFPALFISVRK